MTNREGWQALQSRIGEARTALNTGDRVRALQALDAALAIDPGYLVAQSMRARLLEQGLDSVREPTAKRPESRAFDSAAFADSYARLEERARQRRIVGLTAKARRAIARARLHEAASAMQEIRALDGNRPELNALAEELAAVRRAQTVRQSRTARYGAWAATAVVLGGLIARVGLESPPDPVPPSSNIELPPDRFPQQVQAASQEQIPRQAAAQTLAGSLKAAPDRIGPRPSTIPVRGAVASDQTRAAAPRAEARAGSAFAAAIEVLNNTGPSVESDPASTSAPPGSPLAASTAPPTSAPPGISAMASEAEPAAGSTATTVDVVPDVENDDDQLVRDVLHRYRAAYDQLDAESARSVWPAVNQRALARAFGDLESQTLTFRICDVELDGGAARATCRGTTRFVPKVGSREPHVEPRTWSFSLRKRGADWMIENARAER